MPKKGFKFSEESRSKMRVSRLKFYSKGGEPWNKNKSGYSTSRKGKKFEPMSDNRKEIHSMAAKKAGCGRWMAEKTRENANNWKNGINTYRKIVEDHIGRALKKKERIHHFDGDRKNNSIDNLCLLRAESAHRRLHNFARRHGLVINTLKFEQPWLLGL